MRCPKASKDQPVAGSCAPPCRYNRTRWFFLAYSRLASQVCNRFQCFKFSFSSHVKTVKTSVRGFLQGELMKKSFNIHYCTCFVFFCCCCFSSAVEQLHSTHGRLSLHSAVRGEAEKRHHRINVLPFFDQKVVFFPPQGDQSKS